MITTNETTEGLIQINNITEVIEGLRVKLQDLDITEGAILAINMVEVTQETAMEVDEQSLGQEEYVKVAYPKQDESLVEFLYRYQRKKSKVMLCPRCNSVFDRKAAENVEGVRLAKNRRNLRDTNNQFAFDRRGIPRKQEQGKSGPHSYKPDTYKPMANAPKGKWVKPVERGEQARKKWKNFEVERGSSLAYRKEFQTSKELACRSENYKGKNHMSRSRWRRQQRRRKDERETGEMEKVESSSNVPLKHDRNKENKPVERKLFSSQKEES